MEGMILSYRRGRRHQRPNQTLVEVNGYDTREKANELIGKKTVFKTSAKQPREIKGEITRVHGGKGVVIARWEKGMPGQSFNKKVEIQ